MLVFGSTPETLPVHVARDASTGLPRLSEGDAILQYLLAYLALPYSVVEHGCGKKASLILDRLWQLGIPPHAMQRGLVMEADMSDAALEERDPARRPGALRASNPLWGRLDLTDSMLRAMLEETSDGVRVEDDYVQTGPFRLHHTREVQFELSRSHVYPILWFWDDTGRRAVERVIDPSLQRGELFEVARIRELLEAPESLLFSAPLLGRFRLDPDKLTASQHEQVSSRLDAGRTLEDLSVEEHTELVRQLTGARPGTLGDPATWSYANNMMGGDPEHDETQRRNTGRGSAYRTGLSRLLAAREAHQSDIHGIRADLRDVTEEADVERILSADARWSIGQLQPLADVAMTVVSFESLKRLAALHRDGASVLAYLESPEKLQQLRGMGVRMRRRIDWLARASEDEHGTIDARALTPCFVQVTLETIRQMTAAGLVVCLDKVGNLHGLRLDAASRDALAAGRVTIPALLKCAVAFGSHIDSVKDAGKFDGRLGVGGGIEIAHVLHDLERHRGAPGPDDREGVRLMVSAFIGEEMTFTGRGVSMPGSAAVAGRASVSDVHEMRNGDGDRFGDRLVEMLRVIRDRQRQGEIQVANRFTEDDLDTLLQACFDPADFFTPHTYERHIEQAPVLDRQGVPMAFVGTIMGIHQEDFHFEGGLAEAAALEMNRRMRCVALQSPFRDVRITVGILEPRGPIEIHEHPAVAYRFTLEGERNHAGATATADRRDPGVAVSRLVRAVEEWLAERPALEERGLRPLVGNVSVVPGTNRNVIPGAVSVTLGLTGADLSELEREDFEQSLKGYVTGALAKSVPIGGEGVHGCRVEPISYANVASEARLSIDLRAAEGQTMDAFRERIDGIVEDLRSRYRVRVDSEVKQHLRPSALEPTGQVLLMERSYGGSHNPNEAEMLADITRGCVLQLAVAQDLVGLDTLKPGFNLFQYTEARMPAEWRRVLDRYTSGALHDTCNIAARAAERTSLTRPPPR